MENSPEMLAICRRKADELNLPVTLYTQVVELMELPRNSQSILVPSSSFQLVAELLEAEGTLNRSMNHLQAGGLLVMSVWQIQDNGEGKWGDWRMVAEKQGFDGEKGVRRWDRSMYYSGMRQRHTEVRYELLNGDKVLHTEVHQRSPEWNSGKRWPPVPQTRHNEFCKRRMAKMAKRFCGAWLYFGLARVIERRH